MGCEHAYQAYIDRLTRIRNEIPKTIPDTLNPLKPLFGLDDDYVKGEVEKATQMYSWGLDIMKEEKDLLLQRCRELAVTTIVHIDDGRKPGEKTPHECAAFVTALHDFIRHLWHEREGQGLTPVTSDEMRWLYAQGTAFDEIAAEILSGCMKAQGIFGALSGKMVTKVGALPFTGFGLSELERP